LRIYWKRRDALLTRPELKKAPKIEAVARKKREF
jgi:hypothetical protein